MYFVVRCPYRASLVAPRAEAVAIPPTSVGARAAAGYRPARVAPRGAARGGVDPRRTGPSVAIAEEPRTTPAPSLLLGPPPRPARIQSNAGQQTQQKET